MSSNSTAIIIIIVAAVAIYLIYSQNNQSKNIPQISQFRSSTPNSSSIHQPQSQFQPQPCPKCEQLKLSDQYEKNQQLLPPNTTYVTIDNNNTDPYSDPIKRQDLYSMMDPLTYPQARLPREILEKYNDYYEKNGSYPPFNQSTQPLFDNPIHNGILIKKIEDNEPFTDTIPSAVHLFRVKSNKNTNRFYYYIIDQKYQIPLKIPLENIRLNNVRYNNAEYMGLPEIYDGDIIDNISIYPNTKFRFTSYKTHTFP